MSRAAQEIRGGAGRLASSPAAMFLAVLTLGLGATSTARHLGLSRAGSAAGRRCTVVLACPRTNAARAAAARVHATPAKTGLTAPAGTANSSASSPSAAAANSGPASPVQAVTPERNAGKKTGGGLTVPLPDFNAPELSRFISPL